MKNMIRALKQTESIKSIKVQKYYNNRENKCVNCTFLGLHPVIPVSLNILGFSKGLNYLYVFFLEF